MEWYLSVLPSPQIFLMEERKEPKGRYLWSERLSWGESLQDLKYDKKESNLGFPQIPLILVGTQKDITA